MQFLVLNSYHFVRFVFPGWASRSRQWPNWALSVVASIGYSLMPTSITARYLTSMRWVHQKRPLCCKYKCADMSLATIIYMWVNNSPMYSIQAVPYMYLTRFSNLHELISKVAVKVTIKQLRRMVKNQDAALYSYDVRLCTEWNIPVSPVHALRNEVQPDVQGQPDRAHPGGGSAEHLVSRGERGLRCSCCHKGDICKHTIFTHQRGDTFTHLHIQHTYTHIHIYYIYTHYSVLRLLSSNTVHVPPPLSPVSISKEVRVKKTGSRVQPCLQDKMIFSIYTLCPFRFTLSLIQPCSHTTPLGKPLSLIFFKQLDLQKIYLCNHGDLYCWQRHTLTASLLYIAPAPRPLSLFNSLSCFLMVLHFFVSASVLCLLVLPTSLFFWGCPMKWITKVACWLNNAIKHNVGVWLVW